MVYKRMNIGATSLVYLLIEYIRLLSMIKFTPGRMWLWSLDPYPSYPLRLTHEKG